MKSVMIVFNQSNTDRIEYMLEQLKIKGYTFWEEVHGQGTNDGEPHRGSHTWPELNSAIMTVVPDDKVKCVLRAVKQLDERNKEIGVHAFVWNIEAMV